MYLIDAGKDTEHQSIMQLFNHDGPRIALFQQLDILPTAAWFLVEVREQFTGASREIDIIAGNFTQQSIDPKAIPMPSADYIVAVEVKCSRFLWPSEIRATHNSKAKSRQLESQIGSAFSGGFDKVALFDFVVTSPAPTNSSHGYFEAMTISTKALEKAREVFTDDRLKNNPNAGHYLWTLTGLGGGSERRRGVFPNPSTIRRAAPNHLFAQGKESAIRHRQKIVRNILQLFHDYPPRTFPWILIDCASHNRIHEFPHDTESPCHFKSR